MDAAGEISADPRLLVFEFTYGLVLRKAQVEMVRDFIARVSSSKSMCRQMIMGGGKSSVIAPLLGLLLADGKQETNRNRREELVAPQCAGVQPLANIASVFTGR